MRKLLPILAILASTALATSAGASAPSAMRPGQPSPAFEQVRRCWIETYACGVTCVRYANGRCIIREPRMCQRRVCR